MKTAKLKIKSINPKSSRVNELADVVGLAVMTLDNKKKQCYKIKYKDTTVDYVPFEHVDNGYYVLIES